jgi:hypothetical protein
MITGDNRLTAAAIAAVAGVDDFLAEATPEAKLKLIRDHQAEGRLVAQGLRRVGPGSPRFRTRGGMPKRAVKEFQPMLCFPPWQ